MKAGRIIEENQGIEEPRTKFEDDIPPSNEDYIDDEWLAGVSPPKHTASKKKARTLTPRPIGPGIAKPYDTDKAVNFIAHFHY